MGEIFTRAHKIKYILLDVDGVLTDGGIILDDNGIQGKKFNIKDGWAIVKAGELGFIFGIITGKTSNVVDIRARDLKIDFVRQGVKNKADSYLEFKNKYGAKDEEIAYMGDDLIDLPILLKCGLSAAPLDASTDVKSRVVFISSLNGGCGAVREFVELILKAQNKWDDVVNSFC